MRVLVLLLAVVLSACAGVDPCALDKVADLTVTPVRNVPAVPVRINGHPAILALDTGADGTVLTPEAARRLGVQAGPERILAGGVSGVTSVGVGQVEALALGEGGGAPVLRNVRVSLADGPPPPLDGVLGINALGDFELDLDVPHRRAALFRARSCPAGGPGWEGAFHALPVQQRARSGHLFVPVAVNGEPLRGMLDTGASHTLLSVQAAEDVGVPLRALATLPRAGSRSFGVGGFVVRMAQFRELRVGDDVLPAPVLGIGELPQFVGDVLVGGDYLATRRLWFSFLLGRVFVAD